MIALGSVGALAAGAVASCAGAADEAGISVGFGDVLLLDAGGLDGAGPVIWANAGDAKATRLAVNKTDFMTNLQTDINIATKL